MAGALGILGYVLYVRGMALIKQASAHADPKPSATPTPEQLAVWQKLPREEQVRRVRVLLASHESQTLSDETMESLLKIARERARQNGGL